METFEDLAAVRLREHEIDALIHDLERATGPDRELSDRVLLACGWTKWDRLGCLANDINAPGLNWKNPDGVYAAPLRPLNSLDDALALVPEGWRRIDAIFLEGRDQFFTIENQAMARGNTAPIAVCIAVLRARKEPQ